MMLPFRRFSIVLLFITAALSLSPSWAVAQDEGEDVPPPIPVGVFTVSSLGNALGEVGNVFDAAGRPDMMEMITGVLGDRAGDLEGINREKPFGVMVFLEQGLPPRPHPVFFIPVDNVTEFITTMELGPGAVKRISDTEYEIGRGRRSSTLVIKEDYALMSPMDGEFLKLDLPHPSEVTAALTSRYDVAAAVMVKNIPSGLRELFITYLRAQAESELQQKDEEDLAGYKARRAQGMSTLQLLEQLLRDGEQLTLGLDASADGRRAVLEMFIEATPESEFSQFLKNIGGKASQFDPLLNDAAPLSMSVSWNADKREQEMLSGYIDSLETGLTQNLPETVVGSIEKLAQSLQATVDQGHVNLVFQFIPDEQRRFILIGGAKIVGSTTFGTALRDILSSIGDSEEIESVELDVAQHQNVTFHRLRGTNASDEDKRIYGGVPSFTVGVGSSTVWFGLGNDGVQSALEDAIDLASVPISQQTVSSTAPFQVVFRMLPWMNLPERENSDLNGRMLVEDAMEKQSDAVRIEVRPNETGGRVRVQFDEGFIKLLGLALAQVYDRSQI